jgi:hypothetical protein
MLADACRRRVLIATAEITRWLDTAAARAVEF